MEGKYAGMFDCYREAVYSMTEGGDQERGVYTAVMINAMEHGETLTDDQARIALKAGVSLTSSGADIFKISNSDYDGITYAIETRWTRERMVMDTISLDDSRQWFGGLKAVPEPKGFMW